MKRNTLLGACRRAGDVSVGLLLLSLPFAAPAFAVVKQVTVSPSNPGSCDSVAITVAGDLPGSCHEIVSAVIRGPEFLPCARPTPCPPRFVIEITVREPNPMLGRPCILVGPPYTRSFNAGMLPAGQYTVLARERVVPFASDSTDSTVSESFANGAFTVRPDSACVPGEGCQILWFAPAAPHDPQERCIASVRPGGTACLDLTLMNTSAVGGLQTTLVISDSRGTPASGALIHAVSAEPVGRASGFQVGWTVDGSKTKLILYSTSGASIAPGNGPVVRLCYAVAPETPPQEFPIVNSESIVADPAGRAIPPCPTLALVLPFASICVIGNACDVNGDGVSDVLDVIRLVRCALASRSDSTSACPDSVAARGDCNGDGSVDIRDVICCVRKIVGSSPGGSAFSLPPGIGLAPAGGNSIGFDGPVRWIDAVTASAVLRVDAAQGWGGTEFTIDASGAPGRIRALKLLNGDTTDQLEWAVDANGSVRAILFAAGSVTRPAHTYRVEVALERVGSGSAEGAFQLRELRAGNATGDQTSIDSFNPTLQLSATAVAAPMLLAARPNPTSGTTELEFLLPSDARVNLRVYDVAGHLVRTLIEGPMPAGVHRARWDGADGRGRMARTGLYFTKLQVGATIRSERILLLR